MIEQDWAIILARVKFAFTISFHFLFPAFSIGLASHLAVLEGLWLKTSKGVYANLYRYWLKIFAVVFAMGVVSGIVMSYQFGTNWSVFSDKAGPVIGPLMAYEVLAGWVTTEVGRQTFTIYGLLRTVDSASPLDAPAVAASLLAFVLVYFIVFGAGIWYLLKLMKKPPEAHEAALDGAPIRSAGITPAPAVIEEDGA